MVAVRLQEGAAREGAYHHPFRYNLASGVSVLLAEEAIPLDQLFD